MERKSSFVSGYPQTICFIMPRILNKSFWFFLSILVLPHLTFATHNRAGEISYIQLSDLTIRATITTYTKASSVAADRDSLNLFWGDGTSSTIVRSNAGGQKLPNDIQVNIYIGEHTYPGRGSYTIYMLDPNRIANILNVNPPNSVNIPFYIQTSITLLNQQFQGKNNSVKLLQAPIDFACKGIPFYHNPVAVDPDKDSLSFELVIPLQDKNSPVPNYSFPHQIVPGPLNTLHLDSKTGLLTWDSPQLPGEYNVAFTITEYRKGVKINTTFRDMQIFVRDDCGKNAPPSIQSITDTCIIAGTNLELEVIVRDPDVSGKGSLIRVEAKGDPFQIPDGASFENTPTFQVSPIRAKLIWQTNCNHIQKEFYTFTIRAYDNYFDSFGLVNVKTIRVKVVGPAPLDLRSKLITSVRVQLHWENPYQCQQTTDDYFRGFSIWRSEISTPLVHDTCNPGLSNTIYRPVAFEIRSSDPTGFTYIDTNLNVTKNYCYRIQADFGKISSGGFVYNNVGSLHSNETCELLDRRSPIILNVDVKHTASADGTIFLRWKKPDSNVVDTINNVGPYYFEIYRREKGMQFSTTPMRTLSSPTFANLDSTFVDSFLNTAQKQYEYYIHFHNQSAVFKSLSKPASSLFLNIQPGDNKAFLEWNADVPWTNTHYTIYNAEGSMLDSIGMTDKQKYIVEGLTNDSNFCFIVRSTGNYGITGLQYDLLNHSQKHCVIPKDIEPPCCPELKVVSPCNDEHPHNSNNNILKWTNPISVCGEKDLHHYIIYVKDFDTDSFKILTTIVDPNQTEYTHIVDILFPYCYKIASVDGKGNICNVEQTTCIALCPLYELPNSFTPNGDNHNDIFKAREVKYIAGVDFKVFNRWGQLVFQTNDPNIDWDGKSKQGNLLEPGVYYYDCNYVPYGPNGNTGKATLLKGFIELIYK